MSEQTSEARERGLEDAQSASPRPTDTGSAVETGHGSAVEAGTKSPSKPRTDPEPPDLDPQTDEDAFGDARPGLPHDGRVALATLMTQRFITRARHPHAWDNLLAYEPEIRERLDDLFLSLEIDLEHEVAFKRQIAGDGVPVLLRRDRALSRDASLLLIHLRTEHAYHDAIDEPLAVTRDQVADFLNRFGDGRAHDHVALERRVDAAVRALELYHLLEAADEGGDLLLVSPAVVPLVTPEVLAHLRDAYREAAGHALDGPDPEQAAPVTDSEHEEPSGE